MKIFIIAEAGVNHNGDMSIARKLIDAAAGAGADAVKFQTFKTEKLVNRSANKAKYQIENTGENGSQFEMLKKLELSYANFKELYAYAVKRNIMFMSTPFDEESADMLNTLGVKIFKIPSGEISNKPLIQHVASKKKPIILSTGMSYLGEVEKAINWINEIWGRFKKRPQLTLLHCVSNYPALVEDSNLSVMKTMRKAFTLPVGYSDHTMGVEISVAAAALGAAVIEKHFTLSRNMKGPDHKASLEPNELKAMVNAIRNVEKAIGDGIKRPVKNEKNTRNIARKSIVSARDIKAGNIIASDDILIKRPGNGIQPEFKEIIIGMEIKRNITIDSIITWEDFYA
ncbi:MAG: N-acetylneuraminate synthase [bacterium]|nr:N-acetylneuraminate synthase [bacterium]